MGSDPQGLTPGGRPQLTAGHKPPHAGAERQPLGREHTSARPQYEAPCTRLTVVCADENRALQVARAGQASGRRLQSPARHRRSPRQDRPGCRTARAADLPCSRPSTSDSARIKSALSGPLVTSMSSRPRTFTYSCSHECRRARVNKKLRPRSSFLHGNTDQVGSLMMLAVLLRSRERCRMPTGKRSVTSRRSSRWSADVTKRSNALDLDRGVFTWDDPARIAASLKRSAERSKRRKGDPYRSALS